MFGNLPPPPVAYEGVRKALDSGKYNGYGYSSGLLCAREAVVKEYSTDEAPFTPDVSERDINEQVYYLL